MNKSKFPQNQFILWLDTIYASALINNFILVVIIVGFISFYIETFTGNHFRIPFFIVPAIAIMNLFLLRSKTRFVVEIANLITSILFIGCVLSSVVLLAVTFVINRNL